MGVRLNLGAILVLGRPRAHVPRYAAAMLGVYASAAAILLASLVLGRALLHLLGRTGRPGSRGRSASRR